jgi:hypothetical protein
VFCVLQLETMLQPWLTITMCLQMQLKRSPRDPWTPRLAWPPRQFLLPGAPSSQLPIVDPSEELR